MVIAGGEPCCDIVAKIDERKVLTQFSSTQHVLVLWVFSAVSWGGLTKMDLVREMRPL